MVTCSIVLYRQQPAIVEPLVSSLLKCGIVTRIFLVDNSPTDVLKTLAGTEKVEYIFNNTNIGFGAAHNIAIKKVMASSKYHIVLNPDISFLPGTVENIYNYMEQHPAIGHLMPKVKYPDNSLQYTCKLLPAPADLIFRRFLPAFFSKRRMYRFELRGSGYNKITEVPYMSGCFMFLRIEALQKVGLFDERFFMYPEDIDLTRRIYKYYKTIFYPYAEITHVHERGSYKNIKLLWIHIVNMMRYFNKWGWFFDEERTLINKKIMAQFKHI